MRGTNARYYFANGAQYVLCSLFHVKINTESVNSLKVALKPTVNLFDLFEHWQHKCCLYSASCYLFIDWLITNMRSERQSHEAAGAHT